MDLQEYFREVDDAAPHVEIRARRDVRRLAVAPAIHFAKPTIAMVNGWCFGGAFTPLVCCDLAIAAEDAVVRPLRGQLGHPARRAGLPGAGRDDPGPRRAVVRHDRRALRRPAGRDDAAGQRGRPGRPAAGPHRRGGRASSPAMNTHVLRAAKVGVKKVRQMSWDVAEDYLYAKLDAATGHDPEQGKSRRASGSSSTRRPTGPGSAPTAAPDRSRPRAPPGRCRGSRGSVPGRRRRARRPSAPRRPPPARRSGRAAPGPPG